MHKGIVVTAFERRSFAFIKDYETSDEIFAHVSDFQDCRLFPAGTLVEFEIGTFKNRTKAIKIKPLTSNSVSSADDFEVIS